MITLSWLYWSLRHVLYSSVYSCHLFLNSSASVRFLPFLWGPFLCPSLHEIFSGYLQFSWSNLYSFPVYFSPSISLPCSFKKVLLSLLAILWNSVFSWVCFPFSLALHFSSFLSYLLGFFSQTLCLLAFLFLWVGFGHHLLCSIMNLHPSSSDTLSTRYNPLNLFITSTIWS